MFERQSGQAIFIFLILVAPHFDTLEISPGSNKIDPLPMMFRNVPTNDALNCHHTIISSRYIVVTHESPIKICTSVNFMFFAFLSWTKRVPLHAVLCTCSTHSITSSAIWFTSWMLSLVVHVPFETSQKIGFVQGEKWVITCQLSPHAEQTDDQTRITVVDCTLTVVYDAMLDWASML